MSDSPNTIWNTILLVFLGWLLGLLGPIIVDVIKTRHKNIEIRKAIIAELNETRLRLAIAVYQIESGFGSFDRNLLAWILPILEGYKGPNPSTSLAESIHKQLSFDDLQLEAFAKQNKAKPGGALGLRNTISHILMLALLILVDSVKHLSLRSLIFDPGLICLTKR